MTEIVLRSLEKVSWVKKPEITVVLGGANPHVKRVKKFLSSYSLNTNLYINTNEMAKLILNADLGIGASGSSTWERCSLGLPTISLVIADNQRFVSKTLGEIGAIKLVGENLTLALGLQKAIEEFIKDSHQIGSLSEKCFSLVDGQGVNRILSTMKKLEQKLLH